MREKTLCVMFVFFCIGIFGLMLTAVHTPWWLPFSFAMFVLSWAAYGVAKDEKPSE